MSELLKYKLNVGVRYNTSSFEFTNDNFDFD